MHPYVISICEKGVTISESHTRAANVNDALAKAAAKARRLMGADFGGSVTARPVR